MPSRIGHAESVDSTSCERLDKALLARTSMDREGVLWLMRTRPPSILMTTVIHGDLVPISRSYRSLLRCLSKGSSASSESTPFRNGFGTSTPYRRVFWYLVPCRMGGLATCSLARCRNSSNAHCHKAAAPGPVPYSQPTLTTCRLSHSSAERLGLLRAVPPTR